MTDHIEQSVDQGDRPRTSVLGQQRPFGVDERLGGPVQGLIAGRTLGRLEYTPSIDLVVPA